MQVIRITDKRGAGLYTSGAATKAGLRAGPSSFRPMPHEDGLPSVEDHHRFGFRDEAQLRRWFVGERDELLAANNIQVRVYEVPDQHVKCGYSQLMYHSKRAKLVGIKTLKEIL